MATQPQFEIKHAKIADEFGYGWAVKLFGQNTVDSLPKFERGPNKGKPKGFVHWKKALSAGYSRDYSTPVRPGQMVRAWIGDHLYSLENDAMIARFMGRTQSVCASASLLFEDGRKGWMGELWTPGD